MQLKDPGGLVRRQVHHVEWTSEGEWHPVTYTGQQVTKGLIEGIQVRHAIGISRSQQIS